MKHHSRLLTYGRLSEICVECVASNMNNRWTFSVVTLSLELSPGDSCSRCSHRWSDAPGNENHQIQRNNIPSGLYQEIISEQLTYYFFRNTDVTGSEKKMWEVCIYWLHNSTLNPTPSFPTWSHWHCLAELYCNHWKRTLASPCSTIPKWSNSTEFFQHASICHYQVLAIPSRLGQRPASWISSRCPPWQSWFLHTVTSRWLPSLVLTCIERARAIYSTCRDHAILSQLIPVLSYSSYSCSVLICLTPAQTNATVYHL